MVQIKLLPNRYKKWGWVLMTIGLGLGIYGLFSSSELGLLFQVPSFFHTGILSTDFVWVKWVENDLTDELITCCIIIGGLLIGFSKERDEDEYTALLRLKALTWAVVANYSVLLLATAIIYDFMYLNVMIYNMFTIILIFVGRYQFLLFQFRKSDLE